MNTQIIARVVISGGGAFCYGNEGDRHWDVVTFAEGKGHIVRPNPHAGGGAWPRYQEKGSGFLSVSPSWSATNVDQVLNDGKIVALEHRETKKGEKFIAVLPTHGENPTHLLVLSSWCPDGEVEYIFKGTDSTASGKDSAVETAFIVKVGDEIWDGNTSLYATPDGLKEGLSEGISAEDEENLG